MKRKIQINLFLISLLVSGLCHADAYTVSDFIYHFNLVESQVKEFKVQDCDKIPWLQKGICKEIQDKILAKLGEISPYIGDNALVKRDYWSGSKKYGDKTYITKTDVLLRVLGDTSIGYEDNGLAIDDVFYPYVARFYLNTDASGDGDGYVHNRVCVLHTPWGSCAKHAEWDDGFDMDFYGSVLFDIIAAFTTNAQVVETDDEYILFLQPIFRLVARESDVNIDYDISGIDPFTTIANVLNIGQASFDMSVDLAMFDFNSALDELGIIADSSAVNFVASTVLADDLSNDALFRIASEITTYFADDYLDQETNRVLYEQEKEVNDKIKEKLNLDDSGVVAYHFPKPYIHGQSVAELLPALAILL